MPRSFYLLLVIQFVSTLADNAFLIVTIARVIELAAADWVIPVLKLSFTLFYVLLAPFVGPLADAFPKGRVMLMANLIKMCAVILLLAGMDPTLAIGLAGVGAAIYAPAKYGLITEYLPPESLVKANGFFEGATVCAVIIGTALGGFLISPLMSFFNVSTELFVLSSTSTLLTPGMLAILGLNILASLLSFGMADSGARYPVQPFQSGVLIKCFFKENRILWRDPLGGLSMAVTTLLWGVGATLQLIVLRWAHELLGLSLTQATYLQVVTAVGVVLGAILASRRMTLAKTSGLLPMGMVLGVLISAMLLVKTIVLACVLLVLVGCVAGYFVVPMNALLQHRGCSLLTAGRSIAVQGFNENAGMLLMLGIYAMAVSTQASLDSLIMCFSLLIVLGIASIWISQQKVNLLQRLRP